MIVPDDRWEPGVRDLVRLNKRKHLRSKLSDASFPCLSQLPQRTWREKPGIEAGWPSVTLKQLSQAVEAPNQVEKGLDLRTSEGLLVTDCSEEVQLKVSEVGSYHGYLGSIEQLVVFNFCWGIRLVIYFHRRSNEAASTRLQGLIKHFKIKELFNRTSLACSWILIQVVEVSERVRDLFPFLDLSIELDQVPTGLAEHNNVLALQSDTC